MRGDLLEREPNTEYILSLSYGKDSLACLGAIKELGYPLDRIVHAEVWATDAIPADLPPMIEFKKKADAIILERYGLEVEHIYATRDGEKMTYEKLFYHVPKRQKKAQAREREREREFKANEPIGFPVHTIPWCNSYLKTRCLRISNLNRSRKLVHAAQTESFSESPLVQGADKNIVQYLGIAADEPERIKRHSVSGKIMPLVDIGWNEAYCKKWCEKNDLLSPIYTMVTRGGCWFCHNQCVDQLRFLRKNYPDLWRLLLKWDEDSPTSFKPYGRTVHDFEKRFAAEDQGTIKAGDKKFRWKTVLDNKVATTEGETHE